MTDKRDYLAAIRARNHAPGRMEGCGAVHVRSEGVIQEFQGQPLWEGEVEVFDLMQHPKAKRAYAWAHLDGPKDKETRYVVVL